MKTSRPMRRFFVLIFIVTTFPCRDPSYRGSRGWRIRVLRDLRPVSGGDIHASWGLDPTSDTARLKTGSRFEAWPSRARLPVLAQHR
jgi:hypothetical protein